MNTRVGIVDYGMGNIQSVHNALSYLGIDNCILSDKAAYADCSHLIIPGVGSYKEAMNNLQKRNITAAILTHIGQKKPLLGICLGMQIFSDIGEEMGLSQGLGLIPGRVEQLNLDDFQLPIPHVGWNALVFHQSHPVFQGIKTHIDFYFVHSYFFNASNTDNIIASTEYGKTFPAVVGRDNIIGMQFHPEKSQDNGLQLIENFCTWDGTC